MKEEKYFSFKCPTCGFKIVGNWYEMLEMQYQEHEQEHLPEPIINETISIKT